MREGQLVWVNARGNKGAGRVVQPTTGERIFVKFLNSNEITNVRPGQVEAMDEDAILRDLAASHFS